MPASGSDAMRQLSDRRPSHASIHSFLELLGHGRSYGLASDETETTPTLEAARGLAALAPVNALMLPEAIRLPRSDVDAESNRLSLSSLYSIGSAVYASTRNYSFSGRSSVASESEGTSYAPLHRCVC